MSDYLTDYRARMERNHNALMELAKNVVKADPEVEAYIGRNDVLIKSVVFIKGETINGVAFLEVPYRWSGCGISNHSGGDNVSMPFDVNDVLTTFKPITTILNRQPDEYFKSKEDYLKWCSYLNRMEV
jgi:hypothetical protein